MEDRAENRVRGDMAGLLDRASPESDLHLESRVFTRTAV